jgi:hypothetical protein
MVTSNGPFPKGNRVGIGRVDGVGGIVLEGNEDVVRLSRGEVEEIGLCYYTSSRKLMQASNRRGARVD